MATRGSRARQDIKHMCLNCRTIFMLCRVRGSAQGLASSQPLRRTLFVEYVSSALSASSDSTSSLSYVTYALHGKMVSEFPEKSDSTRSRAIL